MSGFYFNLRTPSRQTPLLKPANLNLWALIKSAPAALLFTDTKINPENYELEKKKWLKGIRYRKLYWLLTEIENARQKHLCDVTGFVKFDAHEMQKTIGAKYARTCRKILENLCIVETMHKYENGYCYLWLRLKSQFRDQNHVTCAWGRTPLNKMKPINQAPMQC